MRYKARYIHRRQQEPEYFRIVYGDSVNDALRMAEKYTRKGFLCVGIISDEL